MAKASPLPGMFGYFVLILLAPYVLNAVIQGPWGVVAAIGLVLALVAVAVVGVRSRGMEFFVMFSKWINDLTTEDKPKTTKGRRIARPSGYWRGQLIEEVGGVCERQTCDHTLDLQVHHIFEHAKGGGNKLRNLIVLCPNCHSVSGTGSFNKERQRTRASRPNRFTTPGFERRWEAKVIQKERAKAQPEDPWLEA